MELSNEFRVGVPIDRAFAVLTDIERIAPCMPGAELQEVEGGEYRGIVKVKVGPITAQYKGAAKLVERDESAHRAVLQAEGRETRGQGNASATITAELRADVDGTHVSIATDLAITGKVAQFGRGVLGDVSSRLIGQFVDCLEANVFAGEAADTATTSAPTPVSSDGESSAPAAASAPAPSSEVRRIESAPARPVDLMQTAGAPVAKRAAPLVAALFVTVWLLRRRRKKRRQG